MSPRLNLSILFFLGLALSACNGGGGGGGGPEEPGYDLVFDGLAQDGQRRLFLWREGASVAEPFARGDAGAGADARHDGKAVLLHSNATLEQPSGLMLISDFQQPAVFLGGRTGAGEREARWSPDGSRILFNGQRDDPAGDIFIADIVGNQLANVKNLTPCQVCGPIPEPDVTPAWSPDGQRIAYTSYASGGAAIWVMDADGGNAHPVTLSDPAWGDYYPAWSPDGGQIAFQRNSSAGTHLHIVQLATGQVRSMNLPSEAFTPSWSPDGQRLAVSLKDGPERDIAIISPQGEILARLSNLGPDYHPTWLKR